MCQPSGLQKDNFDWSMDDNYIFKIVLQLSGLPDRDGENGRTDKA